MLEGRFGLHDREPETLEVLSRPPGPDARARAPDPDEALLKLKRHMVRNGIDRESLF